MAEPVSRVAATYVRLLYDHLQAQDIDAERLLGPLPSSDQHFVALPAWQAMLARVQALEARPALGLRIAAGISARHFGVVGYAALACATLGEALLRLERYHASVYDVNPAVIRHLSDGISIEWGVSRGKPGALVDETAIASLVQLARDMTGRYWPVEEVSFVNPKPDDVQPYEDFFGGVVRFGAPVTRLVLSAEHLALPLRKSDPALLALMDQQAEALLARVASVPAEVEAWRRTLVVLIREGRPALADLARAHHLSPRSLQRRLAEQGLGFQRLLDDTRQHLAEAYMRQPGLDLAEIALLLGFSEQSAFTRAFRQWTGKAPAQWRKQALAETRSPP
ncbi:MAG TPA: AraC family transcriptional regulator [Candidatus Aquabacterium excrementipullorum]|nr:AraC family transcriptional regulator [Candidatus Aquabacterium excrementipullorum]